MSEVCMAVDTLSLLEYLTGFSHLNTMKIDYSSP